MSLPGYGDNWNQAFCTSGCVSVVDGSIDVVFHLRIDTEPGNDKLTLEFTNDCSGQIGWNVLDTWDGVVDTVLVTSYNVGPGPVKVRFHFTSDGALSDEGGFDSRGAVHIDNLHVEGLAVEDFEGESVGDTDATQWSSCTPAGYGDFAGLLTGASLVQEDPFHQNLTCMWGFVTGSTASYACGGHPLQAAVPSGNAMGQYIHNDIWSPQVPLVGSGNSVGLQFDVYRDLDLSRLVFYDWHVRSFVGTCPGPWKDFGSLYYGEAKDWHEHNESIGVLIDPNATSIQIALGVVDMAPTWSGFYGYPGCHSHAPLFDNVVVYRREDPAPQIHLDETLFFHDTAEDSEGFGRADVARNIAPLGAPGVVRGDSMVVMVADPAGLGSDPHTGSGAAVYLVVRVDWENPSGKSGAMLTDDPARWPVVDSTIAGGDTYYYIRMDSLASGPLYTRPDAFCVDLNDRLFKARDRVYSVVAAVNSLGQWAWTKWVNLSRAAVGGENVRAMEDGIEEGVAGYQGGNVVKYLWGVVKITAASLNVLLEYLPVDGVGETSGVDPDEYRQHFEVFRKEQGLPERILYINGSEGQDLLFETAFALLGIQGKVDQYRMFAPRSLLDNGPGSMLGNPMRPYKIIIWDTGAIRHGAIGDGVFPLRSSDWGFLFSFIENNPFPGGVYLCGDHLAEQWVGQVGPDAMAFRQYITFQVVNTDHKKQGQHAIPLIVPEPGGAFSDDFIGSIEPIERDYDVLSPHGAATMQMRYGGPAGPGAVISQRTVNPLGINQGVVLSGFSFYRIRDNDVDGVPDRVRHLRDILIFLGEVIGQPTAANETRYANALMQSYPNPSNPMTAIRFSLREPGHASLKIYDVAGALVRTLVDERVVAGLHSILWDGRSNSGEPVSSGVYFYKLTSKTFVSSKKMVLVK
jgi:hypothetical protein